MSAHRRDYYERALDGLRRLSDHYAIVGAVDQAIRVTLKLLDLDPLDERSHRTLIRLYLSQDRIGAACVQYRRCRDLLNSELGAAPSAETESLRALLLDSYPVDSLDDEAVVAEDDELPESPQAPEIAQANRERARRDLGDAASVAVLPSAPQPAFEHLLPIVEGVAEEVSIALGRVRNLRVFSPSAVIACRDLGLSSEVAGNDLGARYTVTLGVRETDEGLTLLLRLLETRDGRLLWGDRFECSRDELFRVQRQVVEKIISTLLGTIEAAEYERAQRVLTTSWPAYELMNHGWRQLRQLDLGSIDRARNLFHQSLEKDPDLARAYLGLALAHLREWACNSWNMWFFVPETAVNYARKALELDEFDGRAHCILGLCELYGDNQQLAEKRIERSLELNPNDSDILAHSACALALLGEHRHATDCAGRALQLSPYRPDWYASFTGFAYMTARRYDDGIRIMSEAPEAVCDTPSYLATCYAHQGRIEESKRYADTLLRHYRRQIARGDYDAATSCLDWLMSMAPYRRDTDREHFLEGLKLAGFLAPLPYLQTPVPFSPSYPDRAAAYRGTPHVVWRLVKSAICPHYGSQVKKVVQNHQQQAGADVDHESVPDHVAYVDDTGGIGDRARRCAHRHHEVQRYADGDQHGEGLHVDAKAARQRQHQRYQDRGGSRITGDHGYADAEEHQDQ